MKNYFLPAVFLLSFQLAFSQSRHHDHHHENYPNNQIASPNDCHSNYQALPNFSLQLPNFPVQIWIDQKWIGNYSQNFEMVLAPGRHQLCLRYAQNRRGSQINYRNLFFGFIAIKPGIQLFGNCVNYSLPMQFSEFSVTDYYYSGIHENNPNCYENEYATSSFNYFVKSVEDCWFDQDKVELIEQYIRNNQLSSAQIYQLINCLDYESSKLRIAKSAYSFCYDRENYYSIFNLFNYSSSKIELSRYISKC